MRIVVVISDEAQLATAGVRIRYRRIEPHLRMAGHSLELMPIDEFRSASEFDAEVCIFSKCHDVRALVMAGLLRDKGIAIGIDVFDDYFSDRTDSRFVHLREWLCGIEANLSFVLCSSPRMRTRLQALLPRLPAHCLWDPHGAFDVDELARVLELKVERTLSSRVVELSWFGIGDNPHFPLGLSDLLAFGGELAGSLADYLPRLSILTNQRALGRTGLEVLGRLPIPWRVEEWSEELERQTIAESIFCFLPVNAQSFSIVKSLNRAITTLTGGAQVVSSGFPLYDKLATFVYRDAFTLMRDVERRQPALRPETLSDLARLLDDLGGPENEARRLAEFLAIFERSKPRLGRAFRAAVIHGRQSSVSAHKFAQRAGCLSVASPFSRLKVNYDVRLEARLSGPVVVLSPAAVSCLNDGLSSSVRRPDARAGTKAFSHIPLDETSVVMPSDLDHLLESRLSALWLLRYQSTMRFLSDLLRYLFGDLEIYLSESGSPAYANVGAMFPRLDDLTVATTDVA